MGQEQSAARSGVATGSRAAVLGSARGRRARSATGETATERRPRTVRRGDSAQAPWSLDALGVGQRHRRAARDDARAERSAATMFPAARVDAWLDALVVRRASELAADGDPATDNDDDDDAHDAVFIEHHTNESDTLVGLSLLYDVDADIIQQKNKLWRSDNLVSRRTVLIPIESREAFERAARERAKRVLAERAELDEAASELAARLGAPTDVTMRAYVQRAGGDVEAAERLYLRDRPQHARQQGTQPPSQAIESSASTAKARALTPSSQQRMQKSADALFSL